MTDFDRYVFSAAKPQPKNLPRISRIPQIKCSQCRVLSVESVKSVKSVVKNSSQLANTELTKARSGRILSRKPNSLDPFLRFLRFLLFSSQKGTKITKKKGI